MDHVIAAIKCTVALLGGWIAWLLGGVDKLLIALLAFMAMDYITGLLSAWTRRIISSETGFRGIAKKVILLGVVAVAFLIEDITGGGLPLREMTIMFFLANEGLSILENAANAGLPLPKRLVDVLVQVKEKERADEADPPH